MTLGPKGQLYLKTSNPMKFTVPRAKKKDNMWHNGWIIAEGDWGSSLHIGRSKFQVPTQFSGRLEWEA